MLLQKTPLKAFLNPPNINQSNLVKFCQFDPGNLFVLGRSVASKIIHVRPVGGPENTSNNIGEDPNVNSWCDPLDPHPKNPRGSFILKLSMAHFWL